jgi:hypothetical protein
MRQMRTYVPMCMLMTVISMIHYQVMGSDPLKAPRDDNNSVLVNPNDDVFIERAEISYLTSQFLTTKNLTVCDNLNAKINVGPYELIFTAADILSPSGDDGIYFFVPTETVTAEGFNIFGTVLAVPGDPTQLVVAGIEFAIPHNADPTQAWTVYVHFIADPETFTSDPINLQSNLITWTDPTSSTCITNNDQAAESTYNLTVYNCTDFPWTGTATFTFAPNSFPGSAGESATWIISPTALDDNDAVFNTYITSVVVVIPQLPISI